jgi:hypothetical protein
MSPPASSCVDTPSFCITFAPRPKKRIFRPRSCFRSLTSNLNHPEVSGPMASTSKAMTPNSPYFFARISSPPP